jgi:hypothetical protein
MSEAPKSTTDTWPIIETAIDKIYADLEWRGPNGSVSKYVMLTREQAEAVMHKLTATMRKEREV